MGWSSRAQGTAGTRARARAARDRSPRPATMEGARRRAEDGDVAAARQPAEVLRLPRSARAMLVCVMVTVVMQFFLSAFMFVFPIVPTLDCSAEARSSQNENTTQNRPAV